jgi:serine/threonine protein kinase
MEKSYNFIIPMKEEKTYQIDGLNYTIIESLYLDNKTTKILLALNTEGRKVVIKKLRSGYNNAIYTVRTFKHELKMHSLFKHENVVGLYSSRTEGKVNKLNSYKSAFFIVMEYGAKGDLFSIVEQSKSGLSEDKALFYFKQLILGLYDIHCKGITHRDIKLENLILDDTDRLMIADFEFSTYFRENDKMVIFKDSRVGSRGYNAPEIYTRCFYGDKLDIFSAGVDLATLLQGRLPFSDTNVADSTFRLFMEDSKKFICGHFINKQISEDVIALLIRMLEPDYDKRVGFDEILISPIFKCL